MKRAFLSLSLLTAWMIALGCSSQDSKKPGAKASAAAAPAMNMAENRSHPLARHIELAGFRLSEKSRGKVTVEFAVVNHSSADISGLGMNVTLKAATAKPADTGFCAFSIEVATLAPHGVAIAVAECPTSLRIYELPDWQFIRPSFLIVAPAP